MYVRAARHLRVIQNYDLLCSPRTWIVVHNEHLRVSYDTRTMFCTHDPRPIITPGTSFDFLDKFRRLKCFV